MPEETSPPVALALVSDMIFESKISGTGRAVGVSVRTVRTPDALVSAASESGVGLILMDLNVAGAKTAETITNLRSVCGLARIIGFASHVDAGLLEQAREAGADEVMPRSRFDASLGQIMTTCPAVPKS